MNKQRIYIKKNGGGGGGGGGGLPIYSFSAGKEGKEGLCDVNFFSGYRF